MKKSESEKHMNKFPSPPFVVAPPTGTGNSFLIDFKGANVLADVCLKKTELMLWSFE